MKNNKNYGIYDFSDYADEITGTELFLINGGGPSCSGGAQVTGGCGGGSSSAGNTGNGTSTVTTSAPAYCSGGTIVNQGIQSENEDMSLSEEGKDFIKEYEGYSDTIYDAKDPKHEYTPGDTQATGDWTIGYGHKLTDDELLNGTYDNGIEKDKEAAELFNKDKTKMENAVNDVIRGKSKPTQNQFDAMVSFVYSTGENGFKYTDFTDMIGRYGTEISSKEITASADFKKEISDLYREYCPLAGSPVHLGLKKRRFNEAQMFLYGDYIRDEIPGYLFPWSKGIIIQESER